MKSLAYPDEAAAIRVVEDGLLDWTGAEMRAAQWLAGQQPGSVIALHLPDWPGAAWQCPERMAGRSCFVNEDLDFLREPWVPDVGMFVLAGPLDRMQRDTEAALDYFAGRRQPGGILLWLLRPGVVDYLERALSSFFDIEVIAGTRLAVLDLARLKL